PSAQLSASAVHQLEQISVLPGGSRRDIDPADIEVPDGFRGQSIVLGVRLKEANAQRKLGSFLSPRRLNALPYSLRPGNQGTRRIHATQALRQFIHFPQLII